MKFYCNEQLSGFSELQFLLLSETSNWPTVLTDQTSAQIIITPEVYDVDAGVDEESINVDVKEKAKDVFSITIQFTFLVRSEALEQMLDQYKNKPGIAIGCLNNKFKKLYGSNLQPLYLSFEVDDKSKIDDKGLTAVRITGETRKRPVYYTPTV